MDSKVTLVCTKCGLEKLTEEFYKQKASNSGFQSQCKNCVKIYKDNNKEMRAKQMKNWRDNNKERLSEYNEINKEKISKQAKIRHENNKVYNNEKSKIWRDNNKERAKATRVIWREFNKYKEAETCKNWKQNNIDKRRADDAKRRSKKLQACPSWLTKDDEMKIEGLYSKASQMYLDTGITHHVDHEIPLIHPLVCGFHCFSNLRVITAKENLSKSNKFVSYVESDLDPENPKPWEKLYMSIYNFEEVA